MLEVNPVTKWIPDGLSVWEQTGADITLLPLPLESSVPEGNYSFGLKMPAISLPRQNENSHLPQGATILVAASFHLEEVAGSRFVLPPAREVLAPALIQLTQLGFHLRVYPVVNHLGLQYSHLVDNDHLLRHFPTIPNRDYDFQSLDYNDCWDPAKPDLPPRPQPPEVKMIKEDIHDLRLKGFSPELALFFHSDSDNAERSYIYCNQLPWSFCKRLADLVESGWRDNSLSNFTEPPKIEEEGGTWLNNWLVADVNDPSSMEGWLQKRGIPSITLEAPQAADLAKQQEFYEAVIRGISTLTLEGTWP
jgi:hypothetical protein